MRPPFLGQTLVANGAIAWFFLLVAFLVFSMVLLTSVEQRMTRTHGFVLVSGP